MRVCVKNFVMARFICLLFIFQRSYGARHEFNLLTLCELNNFLIIMLSDESEQAVRVERFVTSPLPHRSVRAELPHTVPLNLASPKDMNDISWDEAMGTNASTAW
jgi:hypothetical protein